MARKGGTVTLVGNLVPCVSMPLQMVVTRELSLLGSCASSGEYPVCIDLMTRGAVDVAPLIRRRRRSRKDRPGSIGCIAARAD